MISHLEQLNELTKNEDDRKTGHPRSVKFDGNLVSAVYGPPKPWANAEPLNSDELVATYKLRCESEGMEPFYTVLKQLKDMDLRRSPRSRRSCFNLKGIQLTESHMETLEVIFKHVQFEHLNLENTNLTDSTVIILCDIIEFYDSCTELSLSRNPRITGTGWTRVAQLIQKIPYIRWLDLRDAKLDESAVNRLTASIGSQTTFGQIEYRPDRTSNQSTDIDPVTEDLPNSNPSPGSETHLSVGLHGLHLGSTFIQRPELLCLLNRIRLSLICDLRLPGNRLDPKSASSLIPLLRYGASLRYLDLSHNELQDEGCAMISDAMASTAFSSQAERTRCGLRRLNLSANQLTELSMTAFGKALSKPNQLVCLQLSHNPGLGCLAMRNLQFGLLQCRQLKRLGLANCNIRCIGAVAMAEVLLDRPRQLQVIDLADNCVGTAGLLAFARCFENIHGPVQIKGLGSPTPSDSRNLTTTDSEQLSVPDLLYKESSSRLAALLEQNQAAFPLLPSVTRPRYCELHCPCPSDQIWSSTHSDPRYFWGDSSDEELEQFEEKAISSASTSATIDSHDVIPDPV